ncbi:N-acetylmuramoyl-L-alanine amidase-like domain-containing protein [Providencia vermicola]|uniref:N-acetylmuramoyl-L-alanine amidase-like domain-containing protein n=1 Tax=Providencia TaxID=586 RepID=UPI002349C1A6|nr:N-acetylmuramoyl-L-alanine amidase-like domain-containing protein [Providencia sp. PROV259]
MLKHVVIVVVWLYASIVNAQVALSAGSYTVLMNILSQQRELSQHHQQAEKVEMITQSLIGTPYNKYTLNQSRATIETLVVNLKAMDCMTFIEYTEAFKRSESYEQFITNLTDIRYVDQNISFTNRRHFFSDWAQEPNPIAWDITQQISPHAVMVNKRLNLNNQGSFFIAGVSVKDRLIHYIPVRFVDNNVINHLKTGDYIGIYSKNSGLDVSHVGIIIKQGDNTLFRNASSLKGNLKVSDTELKHYLAGKQGIIIFRAK